MTSAAAPELLAAAPPAAEPVADEGGDEDDVYLMKTDAATGEVKAFSKKLNRLLGTKPTELFNLHTKRLRQGGVSTNNSRWAAFGWGHILISVGPADEPDVHVPEHLRDNPVFMRLLNDFSCACASALFLWAKANDLKEVRILMVRKRPRCCLRWRYRACGCQVRATLHDLKKDVKEKATQSKQRNRDEALGLNRIVQSLLVQPRLALPSNTTVHTITGCSGVVRGHAQTNSFKCL